ncbi:hypothetical protein RSAG8_05921, partial [Rhizoctonia solani AG-8 WAC10335]
MLFLYDMSALLQMTPYNQPGCFILGILLPRVGYGLVLRVWNAIDYTTGRV